MIHSINDAKVDSIVGMTFEPEAIHIMKKGDTSIEQ